MPSARPLWRRRSGNPGQLVEKRQASCAAAGKVCESKIYPDAPHGFNADYRPTYRADAAKDGRARVLAWFRKYGVG
jgi:carboxymethylenebutenolidase